MNTPEFDLIEEDYLLLRNFLITELIIPNGQRPGVIIGVEIGEIRQAKNDKTDEYHKLTISNHKTGYVQSATLFLYPEIYKALEVFIDVVLKKLPGYSIDQSTLTKKSPVFQTYYCQRLSSSRITPILRKFLSHLSIKFEGTVTDLRKAAATLTGKYNPNLHDLMALFMCHSRATQERYYRVKVGRDGLSVAFKNLENFQTNPDSRTYPDECSQGTIDTLRKNSFSFEASNACHSPNSNLHLDTYSELPITSNTPSCQSDGVSFDKGSFNISTPISYLHQPDLYSLNNPISSLHSIMDVNRMNLSIPPIESNDSTENLLELDTNIEPFSRSSRNNSNSNISPISGVVKLKDFHIPLTNMNMTSYRRVAKSCLVTKHSSGKLLFHVVDDTLFMQVFSDLITRIATKIPVTRREILVHASSSVSFRPLLHKLDLVFPKDILFRKIVNKVRTLGAKKQKKTQFHADTISEKVLFNLSSRSQKYILDKKHNRSIFFLNEDELLFRYVFADLIDRVVNRKIVHTHDILDRINDERFIPVLNRLKSVYSEDVYAKIMAKVRTVGLSKRNG